MWPIEACAFVRHEVLPSGSEAWGAGQRCRTSQGVQEKTERRQRRPLLCGLAMEEGERWKKCLWCQKLFLYVRLGSGSDWSTSVPDVKRPPRFYEPG